MHRKVDVKGYWCAALPKITLNKSHFGLTPGSSWSSFLAIIIVQQ